MTNDLRHNNLGDAIEALVPLYVAQLQGRTFAQLQACANRCVEHINLADSLTRRTSIKTKRRDAELRSVSGGDALAATAEGIAVLILTAPAGQAVTAFGRTWVARGDAA